MEGTRRERLAKKREGKRDKEIRKAWEEKKSEGG